MAIDPNSIAQIGTLGGFDPVGSAVKGKESALTIKDMMDREQMNTLATSQAKRKDAEDVQANEILKSSKYDTPQGVMETAEKLQKVSPRAAMDFQTNAAKLSSGKVQAQLDQYDLLDHQQGVIVSAIDPIVSKAREIKQQSGQMAADAYVAQQLPGALKQLQGTKLPNGESALSPQVIQQVQAAAKNGPIGLSTLESFEAKSKQGQQAIKSRIEQLKADTGAKAEETRERGEDEKERHDRAQEAGAKAKAAGFSDQESDLLAALADASVSLPAGLRSQAQIKSTVDGLLRNHPDLSASEIAQGIKSGKLKLSAETKAAQTAGGQIGKVSLATNELDTFGDQTLEASKSVPRGKFVPYSELRQKSDTAISDPDLIRFKGKMQALENAYNQLAARSGTDVEKRAHIHELFNTANSDEAVQSLVKTVKEEAAGAREAADRTIGEVSGAAIPGATPGTTPGAAAPPARSGQTTSGATFKPPADAPTAVGPNGHTIVAVGGKWVDAQTGAPVG
jgi:hypothetical protein